MNNMYNMNNMSNMNELKFGVADPRLNKILEICFYPENSKRIQKMNNIFFHMDISVHPGL